MVLGTLSLVQKGQTSGCSGHGQIVVYGRGNIAFGAKRSNQWTQQMRWNSGIRQWEHCLWRKKVKSVDAVDAVEQWYMMVGTLSLVQKGHIVFTVHSISCIPNDNVPTIIYHNSKYIFPEWIGLISMTLIEWTFLTQWPAVVLFSSANPDSKTGLLQCCSTVPPISSLATITVLLDC